jgi:hypothetical protein
LISDDLAYRHFLSAVAVRSDDSAGRGRRAAIATAVGLLDDDRQLFFAELDEIRRDLDGIESQRAGIGAARVDSQQLADLRRVRRERLNDAARRLGFALSQAGQEQLQRYINETVKTRIKVYRWPDAGAMSH